MENIQYNLQFEKLCEALGLGELRSEPKQLTGGLLHRMFRAETTSGTYAIKALNPQIMLRPKAKTDIVNGERIASHAACFIPALPARQCKGKFISELGGCAFANRTPSI